MSINVNDSAVLSFMHDFWGLYVCYRIASVGIIQKIIPTSFSCMFQIGSFDEEGQKQIPLVTDVANYANSWVDRLEAPFQPSTDVKNVMEYTATYQR